MGSLTANFATTKFSEKCRENQCFKAERHANPHQEGQENSQIELK